jgi:hypothetical protein
LRKSPIVALGLTAALGFGGVAIAQEDTSPGHTLQVTVSPAKAGKKKKPKNVKVGLDIQNNKASGTTAKQIVVKFPKTIKMNPKNFKTCSEATLDPSTGEGPDACPKGSKLGSGTAGAVVNPGSATPAPLNFKNTFFVGGKKQLNIYLEQTNGDVRKLLIGKIGKAGGKYGQQLTIDIPEDLQQPAPQVYSALTDIKTSLKGTAGKGKKKHGFFESRGCTGGLYDFQTQISYAPNPNPPAADKSEANDSVDCKK